MLLRNRLLDGFQRDGRVTLLSTDDSNFQADLELGGSLQAFQTEYQGSSARWWCAWMRCWCAAMTSASSPADALKCASR